MHKMTNTPSNQRIQLPAVVDSSATSLAQITAALGVPRDIVASDDEIAHAWGELPRLLAQIPRELRSEQHAKMCIAVAVGLFDAAINYVWNSAIVELRNKVRRFGLAVVEQRVRDNIIVYELAKNSSDRAEVLLADATLLHALEEFIRAVLYPDTLLSSLYKSIEVIQKRLGVRINFSKIGLSKEFVDYVMERANREEADERHAPTDPKSIQRIDINEKRTCLERAREVISKYVASI